ncbi:hypothetical protein [Saccharopolyspora cebuensis]|uniref:Uncharacterized protein n=1 Tax=Saccharopolyspora cebuensis TaxID=418759 RepID=A0ABV4CAS8_9PSEU
MTTAPPVVAGARAPLVTRGRRTGAGAATRYRTPGRTSDRERPALDQT